VGQFLFCERRTTVALLGGVGASSDTRGVRLIAARLNVEAFWWVAAADGRRFLRRTRASSRPWQPKTRSVYKAKQAEEADATEDAGEEADEEEGDGDGSAKTAAKKAKPPGKDKVLLVATECASRGDPPGDKFLAVAWNIASIRTLVRGALSVTQ
jgi:hypothetical protein